MKPETRLWVKGPDGTACGPFRRSSLCEWIAIGYFTADDEARALNEPVWSPMRTRQDLFVLPAGLEADDGFIRLRARAATPQAVGARAAAYLRRLGCPVPLNRLNPYTAFQWVEFLQGLQPDRIDAIEHWAAKEESEGRTPAATPDEATNEQREILRARGVAVTGKLSQLQAHRLISGPPTAEQLEQLKFCGITLPDGACNEEAANLISRQMRENWAAEEAFRTHQLEAERQEKPVWNLRPTPSLPTVAPSAGSPDAEPSPPQPEPRRPNRFQPVVAIGSVLLVALLLAAVMMRRGKQPAPISTPDAAAQSSPAETPTPTVTVLECPDPTLGERLKQRIMTLDFTGFVSGPEPEVLIGGRLFRTGDKIDGDRGIFIVQIEAATQAVVLGDAAGDIVRRVMPKP